MIRLNTSTSTNNSTNGSTLGGGGLNSSPQLRYGCIFNNKIHPLRQYYQNNQMNYDLELKRSDVFSERLHVHLVIHFLSLNNIIPNVTSIIYINGRYYGTIDKMNQALEVDLLYENSIFVSIKEMNTLIFNSTFKEEKFQSILGKYKNSFFDNINLNMVKNYIKSGKLGLEYNELDKFLNDENVKLNNEMKKFKSIIQLQTSDLTDKLNYQTKNASPKGATNDEQLVEWATRQFKLIEDDMMNRYLNILQCVNIMKHFNSNILPNADPNTAKQIKLLFELIQDKSLDKISSPELKNQRKDINYLISEKLEILKRTSQE